MKFDEMFLAIKEANKRFYKISKLRERIAVSNEKRNSEIFSKNEELINNLNLRTEEFLKFEIDKYIEKLDLIIEDLVRTLNANLASEIMMNSGDYEFDELNTGENIREQYQNLVLDLIVSVNEKIENLNKMNFSIEDPIDEFKHKDELYWTSFSFQDKEVNYNSKPITFESRYKFVAFNRIKDIVNTITGLKKALLLYKEAFDNDLKRKSFDQYLEKFGNQWIDEENQIVYNVYIEIFKTEDFPCDGLG